MKKIIPFVLTALLAACSNPQDIVLNSREDIEKHSEELKKLPEEDKKLLLAYIFRHTFVGEKEAYGITVKQAIEKQKAFIADEEIKEKQAQAKSAEFSKQYGIKFAGFDKVDDIPGVGSGINLKFAMGNNSGKAISVVRGSISIDIEGLEGGQRLLIDEKFEPAVNQGESGVIEFLTTANSIHMAKIEQGTANVTAKWEELEILHTDGTVVKFPEK